MRVLGISPLDKDATVSLVEDGRVLFAAGEERFSRQKQHAGFPKQALAAALDTANIGPDDIDLVVYAFLPADQEARLIEKSVSEAQTLPSPGRWRTELRQANRTGRKAAPAIPGVGAVEVGVSKPLLKRAAYQFLGTAPGVSSVVDRHLGRMWVKRAVAAHRMWQEDLEAGLAGAGVTAPLKRYEHHVAHAANAYHASGFERALIVSLDGYGSGLAGAVSLGEGGKIRRLHNLKFPHSLGTFYEKVTSALGYKPDRHAGKIVGLAAYGDPSILGPVLRARMEARDGDYAIHEVFNHYFDFHLAVRFPMIDTAAAYQFVLETIAADVVRHWVDEADCDTVVLSGGVAANVKMNQRIFEIDGVNHIFVYPNMGDGGCGTGLALNVTLNGTTGAAIDDVYYGPSYSESEIEAALAAAGLNFWRPANLAEEAAKRIHAGEVVARFDGRMEYGPRALGNRSVLYHAREPDVNNWLNKRLGRTEFMPFAPVTLWEARSRCYHNIAGAEHSAQFMTITFDCTDWMRANCPAAVHVDGTARPQLIKRDVNPGYYDILAEYEKLSGIPTIVNTSFNMHEEPIVCSPADAVRSFLQGHLDVLVAGPFMAEHPNLQRKPNGSTPPT